MSWTYKIYKEQKLNYVKASGLTLGKEIIETTKKMFNDPEWKFVRRQISDFRDVKEFVVTFSEFDKLIDLEKEHQEEQEKIHNGETGKMAIVAQKDLYDIIFKLYKVKTKDGSHETQIFNNIEDALAWLNETSENYLITQESQILMQDIKN